MLTKLRTVINERSLIYILAGTVVAGAGGAAAFSAFGETTQKATSQTYVAAAHVQADSSAANGVTGLVQSARPLQASAVVGGRIVQINGQIGEPVVAGQVLARIDNRAATLRVDQADAEVQQASAAAAERASAAKRTSTLVGIGAMSEAERQSAQAEAQVGQARVRAARDAAALARTEAQYTVVRAPASGIIATRTVELGTVVGPGQVMFTLEGATGNMILAAAPQTLASQVRLGSSVRYGTDNIQGVARVTGISPRVEGGGVIPVRLTIVSGRPAAGAIVRVQLSAASPQGNAVRVPLTAIQSTPGGRRFVYRIDARQRVTPVPVTVLSLTGADARIAGSLPVGATIVAAGGAFLNPHQTVRIAVPGA